MLVEHEGRLIPIEEPIDLAERRPTPHPSQVIDLTDDSDDVMLGSSGSSIESIRDFGEEEEECQEIGLVALIFFFELLFSYVFFCNFLLCFPY